MEFRHIPLWIEMEQEKSGKWQQVVAVKVVNLLEERQQPEEAAWRLFPRKVSQSQPKVQISLEVGLPANPPLELNLTLNNTSYTLLDAKWLKQDLLQVELPPTLFRSTSIGTAALIIDGSHLGSRQLKLENAATMLESIWQVRVNYFQREAIFHLSSQSQATSDPVSLLSDAFSASFSGLAEIDDFLKASIEERLSVADLLGRPGHHQPQGDENLVSGIVFIQCLKSLSSQGWRPCHSSTFRCHPWPCQTCHITSLFRAQQVALILCPLFSDFCKLLRVKISRISLHQVSKSSKHSGSDTSRVRRSSWPPCSSQAAKTASPTSAAL